MAEPQRVGDYVTLYSEEFYGFVYAQVSSCDHATLYVSHKVNKQKPQLPNYQVATFQVCVQNRYKANKRYRKAKEASDAQSSDVSKKKIASQIKIAANAEDLDNLQEQKRQKGKPLKYGQIIQLKHLFSNKYIHVSTTQTSETEFSNMKVELLPHNSKLAQFRIMPRYKVKSEGDTVQIEDQIVLESFKSAGQYLHCSKTTLGKESIEPLSSEINLSVRQSGFTVNKFYTPKDEHKNLVRGGSVVQLFHKELEANLTAEGMFNSHISEEVHLRVRLSDPNRPKSLFPSTSAVTFWQIEAEESMMKGDVFFWEQQCRIKHLTTRKYLAISKEENIILSDNGLDPNTVFRLHPVIPEFDKIEFESYCRIEHVVTGYWLHGLNEEFISKKSQETVVRKEGIMKGLEWDGGLLKKISVSKEKLYDDAFTIQQIPEDQIEIFNFVAGVVLVFDNVVKKKKKGQILSPKKANSVVNTLKELQDFMVVNSEPVKIRQKLLRNLELIDVLVKLCQIPFFGSPDEKLMTTIILHCYQVMYTYVLGDSRKNELYLAKNIDFFQSQFIRDGPVGLQAAHMVKELFMDNRKIIDRVSKSQIVEIIDLLKRNKNHRYLELLGVLCVCNGVAIPENQTFITNEWLVKGKQSKLLYFTEVGSAIGKNPNTVYVSVDSKHWIPLSEFVADHLSIRVEFLNHQLDLFGKLCFGRNKFAINVITEELGYLTWTEAMMCLKSEELPEKLRAKYCDLIISLFVDIGEKEPYLERINLLFEWDAISENRSSKNTQDMQLHDEFSQTNFPELKQWINFFLENNTEMISSEIGHNMLIEQVLRLIHALAKFGYFGNTEDTKNLLLPMLRLMDGRNDKPFPEILKDGNSQVAHKELVNLYQTEQRYEQSEETKAIVDAKYQALQVIDLFYNLRFNTRLERFVEKFKQINYELSKDMKTQSYHTQQEYIEMFPLLNEDFDPAFSKGAAKKAVYSLAELFDNSAYFKGEKGQELTKVLMDLSNYKYDKMVQSSIYLLNRKNSAYFNLFTRAVETQVLITPNSVKVMHYCNKNLPILRRLSTKKITDEQSDVMEEILDKLTEFCSLEGEPEEPHPVNQAILYNFRVLADIFDFLSQQLDSRLMEQYHSVKKIFKKCFIFLKVMARENPIVQMRLYNRIDSLLAVAGAEIEMAETLTEVFTGNKSTCLKIRTVQIQRIMQLQAQYTYDVPEFFNLLNAIVKVEEINLPIKRNQSSVMKFFMQYRSEVAQVIDQPSDKRMELLMSEDQTDPKLAYMLALVDLLATCAEGENQFIESICQTIFQLDELMAVLLSQSISNKVKGPFLRFLVWVYMNTASGIVESGVGELQHDKEMWTYLEDLIGEFNKLTIYIMSEEEKVKQQLKKQPIKNDTSADGQFHASLHYIFEGVFPMLQVFFMQFYQIDKYSYPEEPDKLDKLAGAMLKFVESVSDLLSNMNQMKIMVSSMTAVLTSSTLPPEVMENFKSKYRSGGRGQDIRSDAQKDYEEYYKEEIELNELLNTFAQNCKLAYEGENKVSTQLKCDPEIYDRDYTEVGGDEELPLGEEFQDLIKCFINGEKKVTNDHGIDHLKSLAMQGGLKKKKKSAIKEYRYAMASKLVTQLLISYNYPHAQERDKLQQEQLDIKCLQILRALIHNEQCRLPIDWEYKPKENEDRLERLTLVQNELNDYDAMLKVLPLLSRTSEKLAREVLAFLSAMLYAGNANVQKCLITYFTGTREEHFFIAVKQRMHLSSVVTKEKRSLQAQHRAKLEEMFEQQKSLNKAMKHGQISEAIIKATAGLNRKGSKGGSTAKLQGSKFMGSSVSFRKSQISMSRSMMSVKRKNRVGPSNALDAKTSMFNNEQKIRTEDKLPLVVFKSDSKDNSVVDLANGSDHENDIPPEMLVLIEEAERDSNEFKDDGYIEMVLRILGQICDGQHLDLQNYLREQPDNIKSINLVAETSRFLDLLYSSIDEGSIALVEQIYNTLNEFAQGNYANSVVILDNKVIDYTNFILRDNSLENKISEDNQNMITELKESIAKLIHSLIEQNGPDWNIITKDIRETLDIELIHNIMIEYYKKFKNSKGNQQEKDRLLFVGYSYYQIIARLHDIDKIITKNALIKSKPSEKDWVSECEKAWAFYQESSMSIEVVKDGELQRIHFRVKDQTVLREEVKEKLKWNVDRSSPSNKLRDFVDWSHDIREDIAYQTKIQSYRIFKFFLLLMPLWTALVIILTLAINIMIVATWKANDVENNGIIDYSNTVPSTPNGYDVSLYVLGSFHCFASLCLVIAYLLFNNPKFPKWNHIVRWFRELVGLPVGRVKEKESRLETKFLSFITFYYLIMFGFSIAGVLFHGYFFCFHLLHIAVGNQLLTRVVQSVTLNGKSLLWVGVLGVIIIYIFAIVGFAYFRSNFDQSVGLYCTTMYECFVTSIRFGLIEGIQNYLVVPEAENTFYNHLMRTIYDVIFYIIIILVGLNIIFGIIVDTFSELRDSKWRTEEDMRILCFVCSRNSYDFEHYSKGFDHHVKTEHNMWSYLFFFIHLEETREVDYTAVELYVHNMLKNEDYNFFPLNRALCLSNQDSDYDNKLDLLISKVEHLVKKQKEEEAKQERIRLQQKQAQWAEQHRLK